jgi:hypothetical protein
LFHDVGAVELASLEEIVSGDVVAVSVVAGVEEASVVEGVDDASLAAVRLTTRTVRVASPTAPVGSITRYVIVCSAGKDVSIVGV